MGDSKDFTIFIRNFDSKLVTHDLLLELFTQAGPVQNLTLKEDFAFLEFEDKESVMYACNLLNDTALFGIPLQVKPRNGSIWENEEFFKFPSQSSAEDFSNDNHFNESDYRPNDRFVDNNSFYEQPNNNYRQQQQQQQHNRPLNSYSELDYRQQQQQQQNRSLNNYSEPDYRQQPNRLSFNAFRDSSEYRYIAPDAARQNRPPQKLQHERRYDQWIDNRPAMNKSFGSYRDRPY